MLAKHSQLIYGSSCGASPCCEGPHESGVYESIRILIHLYTWGCAGLVPSVRVSLSPIPLGAVRALLRSSGGFEISVMAAQCHALAGCCLSHHRAAMTFSGLSQSVGLDKYLQSPFQYKYHKQDIFDDIVLILMTVSPNWPCPFVPSPERHCECNCVGRQTLNRHPKKLQSKNQRGHNA